MANVAKKIAISAQDLTKTFYLGEKEISALSGVDLDVFEGDFAVIFGPSGCGKSTLLNILVGLEKPSEGICEVFGKNIYLLESDEIGKFRGKIFGIIHQQSYWVQSLNVLENIALPLITNGFSEKESLQRATEIMESLKIGKLSYQKPGQLSAGEQQKASCARALVPDPEILIADEPTGNLDSTSADALVGIIESLNRGWQKTVVMVTHNPAYREVGNRQIQMRDGKIVKEEDRSWL